MQLQKDHSNELEIMQYCGENIKKHVLQEIKASTCEERTSKLLTIKWFLDNEIISRTS